MEIVNITNDFTDKQLETFFNIFDETYFPEKIHLFDDKEKMGNYLKEKNWHNTILKDYLNPSMNALYDPVNDIVAYYLSDEGGYERYSDKYSISDIRKILFISTMTHELRHVHQEKTNLFPSNKVREYLYWVIREIHPTIYMTISRRERDANNFSKTFIKANITYLRRILEIDVDERGIAFLVDKLY